MARSLCAHFQSRVAQIGDRTAIRNADGTVELTWRQYGEQVREVAAGLAAIGVGRGDRVGIMVSNRPEFHVIDAAVMHLGGIGFSVYNTSAPDQIAYLLTNAAPRVVVTEPQFLEKIREAAAKVKPRNAVKTIVCLDEAPEKTISLSTLIAGADPDFDFDAAWRAVEADDVLTLIYTSGTTGNPKGVELTHANLLYQLEIITDVVGDLSDGRVISYLPDAHLINRWICQYAPMYFGITVTDVDNPKTLVAVLGQVRPTFFVAVPMLWYKIKAAIEATIAGETGPKGTLARWALEVGRRRSAAIVAGSEPSPVDAAQWLLADRLVLSKVRARLGFDSLTAAVSGAAPIDVAACEFMLAIGVPVLEAWGMSETSAVTTVNPVDRPKYGTVGRAIPGTQVALAADGEVLVRGGGVMRGYHNDPARTADVLDADGWIHTGDVGTLDDEGYLSIVDRKKELIINDGGKNMSPSNIEGALKAASGLVGTAVAIGDARPYITALITLDPDAAAALAEKLSLDPADVQAIVEHPTVLAQITAAVEAANQRLSRVEHIRRWHLLPSFWAPGGDELTPTMKLKRAPIATKYADQIEALYAAGQHGAPSRQESTR